LFVMILAGSALAQWPRLDRPGDRWIRVRDKISCDCDAAYEVSAGISYQELNDVGLPSIGAGRSDYGYFAYSGGWELGPSGFMVGYVMFPPSLITPEYVWPNPVSYFCDRYCSHCGCKYDQIFPSVDTSNLIEGFGFAWANPERPWNIWLINDGYVKTISHIHTCLKQPCPPGGGEWLPKFYIAFTDSLYNNDLADSAIVSGDSPLYLDAHFAYDTTKVFVVRLFLENRLEHAILDTMQYLGDHHWGCNMVSARELGLKSYNTVVAHGFPLGGDTLGGNWWKDRLDVALPKIRTQVRAVFTDTVFIRSDSMKVRDSLVVSLTFLRDSNNAPLSVNDKVDSAGYKYKSRWKANVGVKPDSFYRQFPASSLTYRKWNKITANCGVGLNRDSLYAIGGKLTIECKGKLKPIPNINNSFKVDTDTLAANGRDTLQTRRILIDRDPPNASFFAALQDTIIKAIAWIEYAGSNDPGRHCHDPYNPRYNNYWDFVIAHGDTCVDSLAPCENRISTATGTMQMLRTVWAPAFRRPDYIPPGYYRTEWDSLAWSWKINVQNGRFIYFTDNFFRINHNARQSHWDSLCTRCSPSDSFPAFPNKEDLAVYGYKYGAGVMGHVNDDNWKETVKADTFYVVPIRSAKYRRPWE